jgi:hypothetical protein
LAKNVAVQLRCEYVDLARELGIGVQLEFLCVEVMIGFGLLEGCLAVLADQHER